MKIVLAALNAKYVHSNLAVYDLEAYAKKQQRRAEEGLQTKDTEWAEIVVKEYTINHNLDSILQSLYQEKAAVVAFSCYIWNIQEILMIARELKKVLPDVRIWFGGPEASYDGHRLLEQYPFVEGIMLGEGEVTFYELTRIWQQTKDVRQIFLGYEDVLGIVYRNGEGTICRNPVRPQMRLDELPFIYTDLSSFQNKILYYETSRGCPFSCSYCLSSIDKKVRFRSLKLVERELSFFLEKRVPQVKFIDRTFNCNREHALAIWRYITAHDNGVTNFHFEVAADLIGEEELALFQTMRPGLIQLEIGLQSTNPATIREIRRVMDVERLRKNMLTIRSFGNIHQHLDLIAGLPYEDFATFQQSFQEAYAMMPNQLQLGFLKVLKGSYMGEQVERYGLIYQEVQPYEVLSTRWISYDEILILKKVEEMVEVYYNSDQFEHVLPYVISFFKNPYAFYEALGMYYEENALFGIGCKREARYEILRNFCLQYFAAKDAEGDRNHVSVTVLDSLLTFDYYLRENAKSRPAWAREEPIEKSVYQRFFRNGGNAEISLLRDGYDSKVAARMMHIEPVVGDALRWLSDKEPVWCQNVQPDSVYCLFDYEARNPLSKDAGVSFLSVL